MSSCLFARSRPPTPPLTLKNATSIAGNNYEALLNLDNLLFHGGSTVPMGTDANVHEVHKFQTGQTYLISTNRASAQIHSRPSPTPITNHP